MSSLQIVDRIADNPVDEPDKKDKKQNLKEYPAYLGIVERRHLAGVDRAQWVL
jgi:hypothetical protein